MKIKQISIFCLFFLLLGVLRVEAGSFDNDLSELRKRIIPMCAKLQTGKAAEENQALLREIDGIITDWNVMIKKYASNAPAEYAKDPGWGGYFYNAGENFRLMREYAASKNYKRAMQFCGINCQLFVHIHLVNGKITVTDRIFELRKLIRLSREMALASNWDGVASIEKRYLLPSTKSML